ncbi:MAG: FadR family transcriptional regulator [Anaerolineales bacterium]|nr:FadR family transcriptional regulator [Anaerolineales bacterium]
MADWNNLDYGTFDKEVLSEQIAARIVKLIKERQLKPGDRLPPERELATIMGVSRPSLREALKALSILNIIKHRQGAGTFVTSLEPKLLVEHLDFVFALDDSTYLELFQARKVIEGGLAEMAANRILDEELAHLHTLQQKMPEKIDEPEAFLRLDMEMHQRICDAAGNSILARVMAALVSLGVHSRRRTTESIEVRTRTIEDHQAILSALEQHDSECAREAMIKHLSNIEKTLRPTNK